MRSAAALDAVGAGAGLLMLLLLGDANVHSAPVVPLGLSPRRAGEKDRAAAGAGAAVGEGDVTAAAAPTAPAAAACVAGAGDCMAWPARESVRQQRAERGQLACIHRVARGGPDVLRDLKIATFTTLAALLSRLR